MSQNRRPRRRLPDGFILIDDIIDSKPGFAPIVNVIGVVVDFRTPFATRGSDWKCQITLQDPSIEPEDESGRSIRFDIFRPQQEMPDSGYCDIVILFQAKIQRRGDVVSLITNRTTDIHIYCANKIPRPPKDASQALRPPVRNTTRDPNEAENEYVSYVHHSINKDSLPSEQEFEVMKMNSANVNHKFRELKDLQESGFVDAVVQIVKPPQDHGDKFTLWISDYTEHDSFFNFAFKGGGPFGYTESMSDWTGPFGKRSMQISCFEPHASYIRDRRISEGSWVLLRNLQIKWGRNGNNLEGYLREDRHTPGVKINIATMDLADGENIDPRLKEALRRKRDYERQKKQELKGISEAAKAGQKRKSDVAEMEKPTNSRKRREAKRAAKRAAMEEVQQLATAASLNSHVKCENQNKAPSTVEDMLKPVCVQTRVEGEDVKLEMPFINASYRANVRVVNFMPSNLEDFARPKKSSEFDMLSDNDESDTGSESESELDTMRNVTAALEWEWRFFLELEDTTPATGVQGQKGKNTVWVAVDNQAAQCLMDLDACNLRTDYDTLEALRQRLFILWGELEENKSREAAEKKKRAASAARRNGPPLDSSDNEGSAVKQEDKKAAEVHNRPFACCIRQYGVKVTESDPNKADAGNGKRWQRVFALFGTRITRT